MKTLALTSVIFCLTLVGCNTVGPYTAKVYRLESSVYMVNVDTWLGSDRGWPHGNEEIQRTTEAVVKNELLARGLSVETCVFMKFTPYQGGHMSMTFVAGKGLVARKWATMTQEEFDAELRIRPSLPDVLQFEGRINIP